MAFALANADIVQIKIYCQVLAAQQLSINTIYYQAQTPVGGITDQDTANALSALFATDLKPMMSSHALFFGASCQIFSPANRKAPTVFSTSGQGAGTNSFQNTPTQVAALVRCATGDYHLAPSGKTKLAEGRAYIPFVPATAIDDDGGMRSSYFSQLQTLASHYYDVRTITGTGKSVTLIPFIRFTNSTNTKTFTAVTTFSASRLFATQRRRGDRGRKNIVPF